MALEILMIHYLDFFCFSCIFSSDPAKYQKARFLVIEKIQSVVVVLLATE